MPKKKKAKKIKKENYKKVKLKPTSKVEDKNFNNWSG